MREERERERAKCADDVSPSVEEKVWFVTFFSFFVPPLDMYSTVAFQKDECEKKKQKAKSCCVSLWDDGMREGEGGTHDTIGGATCSTDTQDI